MPASAGGDYMKGKKMVLSQKETLDLVMSVLDRLAQGEDFNSVVEETGVTERVSEAWGIANRFEYDVEHLLAGVYSHLPHIDDEGRYLESAADSVCGYSKKFQKAAGGCCGR